MRGEDNSPTVSMILEEFNTGSSSLIGVCAKARTPCRISHLQWVMHQVGTQDRFLSPAAQAHEREARRVAWRRLQCDSTCPDLKIGKTLSLM